MASTQRPPKRGLCQRVHHTKSVWWPYLNTMAHHSESLWLRRPPYHSKLLWHSKLIWPYFFTGPSIFNTVGSFGCAEEPILNLLLSCFPPTFRISRNPTFDLLFPNFNFLRGFGACSRFVASQIERRFHRKGAVFFTVEAASTPPFPRDNPSPPPPPHPYICVK